VRFSIKAAVIAIACVSLHAFAQSPPPDLQPVPEPPPMPERVESGEVLEPEVRIVRKDQATVTEYRVNGRLRAIKVQPDGDLPAYYLYDTDGDGRLDRRRARFDPDLLIPNWVLFSW
jgi:hypothetical protein